MDTIGYAIEEWIYVPSEMQDALGSKEPKWKKRAKIVIILILFLIFGLFSFYQAWISVQSYKSPAWTSYEEDRATANFPGILLCPSRSLRKSMTSAGCVFEDNQMIISKDSNYSICSDRKVITDSLDTTLSCINYNFDALAIADATSSYLIVFANIDNSTSTNNSRHLSEGTLDKRPNNNNNTHNDIITTIQYPMLLYVYPVGTAYDFLNDTVPTNLKPSVYFSYASLRVTVWSQYIAHDWITACGVVAGLTGFLRSVWYVAFMILDRLQKKWEKEEEPEFDKMNTTNNDSMASFQSMQSLDQMRQPIVPINDDDDD